MDIASSMAECLPSMHRPWVQSPAPQNKFKKQMIFKILSNAYMFLKTLSFILEPYPSASCTLVKQCILHLGVIEEILHIMISAINMLHVLRMLKTWCLCVQFNLSGDGIILGSYLEKMVSLQCLI